MKSLPRLPGPVRLAAWAASLIALPAAAGAVDVIGHAANPGDVGTVTYTISNPASLGSAFSSARIEPHPSEHVEVITGESDLGDYEIPDGTQRTFTVRYRLKDTAAQGLSGLMLQPAFLVPAVNASNAPSVTPTFVDARKFVVMAVDFSSPTATLTVTPPLLPDGSQPPDVVLPPVIGEFPSSPIALSTPPAVSAARLAVSARDLLSGLASAAVYEDGVQLTSSSYTGYGAAEFAFDLKDGSLYRLEARDTVGNLTVGHFVADTKRPELDIVVRTEPQDPENYAGVNDHTVFVTASDSVWLKDLILAPAGAIDFGTLSGANWESLRADYGIPFPPGVTTLPPGTKEFTLPFPNLPNGDYVAMAVDSAGQIGAQATVSFFDENREVPVLAPGSGTADCHSGVLWKDGAWRLGADTVQGGLVARGTASAVIGMSQNAGSIYSTWLQGIEVTVPAGHFTPDPYTFEADDGVLELPTGGRIAFGANARAPQDPLFFTQGQSFDEEVGPAAPGRLLRGQQARLFLNFEFDLVTSTPPAVSHAVARVRDHVVKIVQSGTADGSRGRYHLEPGLDVELTAVSPQGATVQLLIDRVDLPGEASVIDLALNNDALGCPFTAAAPKGTGAVDVLVTAAGSQEITVTLPLKDTVCAAAAEPQLIHVGHRGAENVTEVVDRANCRVTGKANSASPFFLLVPSGADAAAPTTVVDSSYSVRDDQSRAIVSPSMPLPFTGEDAGGPVALTEYRLAGEAFQSLSVPLGGATGLRTVEVRSRDRAGNLEVAKSTQVHVDADAPTVAIPSLQEYTNNPRPTFRATFSDDLAALDTSNLTFSVDGTTIPAALIASSTGPLTWLTAPSLPFGVYLHSMLYSNGFLYTLGGVDAAGAYRTDVSLSPIGPGGAPGAWAPTTRLKTPSVVMGAASTLGRLYVMGGVPGGNTVRYAQVLSTGNLSGWEDAPALPASLRGLEGVAVDAADSYLYAIGGQDLDPGNAQHREVYVSRVDAQSGAPIGWSRTLDLPYAVSVAASCVWNGRIYVLGGNTSGDSTVNYVRSAVIGAQGAILRWETETPLPLPTLGARAVAVGGRVYFMGGFTQGSRTDAVYSALISSTGNLGAWRPETSLHTPLYFAAAAAPAGAIYYGGGIVGSAGTADVRYALVLPPDAAPKQAELLATPLEPLDDGTYALLARGADRVANAQTAIGSITVDLTPPTVTLSAAGVELSSAAERFVTDATPVLVAAFHDTTSGVDPPTARLFLDGADVTPAPPSATLTLTPASLAPGRHTLEARAADRAGNAVSLAAIFFVDADPPSVALTAPVPETVYGTSVPLAALFSDEGSGLDPMTLALSVDGTTYASVVRPGPGAAALEWLTAPSLPFGVYLHSMLYANGFLYTLGGVDAAGAYRTDVSLSPIGPDGVPGDWAPTTRLKTPSVVMGAASTLGRLYIMGGVPEGTTVRYAQVLSTGNLSAWEDALPLPTSLRGLEGVAIDAAGSYLYAIGGQDLDPGNAQHREVYVSRVDAQSGAPLGWSRTLDLPYELSVAASCVWNGRIYVLGGNTTGDSTVDYVRSAVVDTDGEILRWETETPLPLPTLGARAVAVSGRVYFMGGFTQGARTDAVYSALISSTGNLGAWRPETPLHTPLYFAAAAAPAGAIYYGGGIVGSAGTADVRYALLAGGSLLASATAQGLAEGGPHVARAQAADLAGNTAFASATFHVDLSAPLTELIVQGASSTAPGLVLAPSASTVTLTPRDFPLGINAGVTATYLAVNGGPLGPAPATLSLSTGTSLLEFWSVDGLGHVESTQTVLVTLQDAQSVAVAVDGTAGISAAQEVTISTLETVNAPGAYRVSAELLGLESVFPVYYELSGGTFPPGEPALLSFYIDLAVVTDPTALRIYTFNESSQTWDSSSIYNQKFTLLSENYGVFTGELLHTSAYALMRRSIITDPVAPTVAFAFPRPDEPGLCRLAQGPVRVRGSVTDEEPASWSLMQGSVLVGSGTANADGTLGVWDATGLSGAFGLALSALDASGNTASAALNVQAGEPARVLALGGRQVLNKPRGVAAGADRVYVADTNADRVRVFDAGGAALAVLGDKKGAAKLNKPAGLALDAAGNILVADANNKRVVKLSPAGAWLAEYGNGVLKRPTAVALSLGRVVVADAKAGELVVFSDAGALLARVDLPPAPAAPDEDPEEPRPVALAADAAGHVWAADAKGGRVLRFTPDLALAQAIPGFGRPEGVAVSPSGACLAVSDAKAARIRTFDAGLSAGLASFGVHGEVKENKPLPSEFLLNKPAQLAFTADGSLLVADRNNDLVQGFGLPGTPAVVAMGTPGRSGGGSRLASADGGAGEVIASARVGRFEGGRVEHPDGAAVEIPAGAVTEDVDVAVAAAPDAGDEHRVREAGRSLAGLAAASAAREFSPHGLTFREPALITLPYDPLLAAAARALKIHYWNPERGAWEALDSEVDEGARTVSARVAHFSVYQVLAPASAVSVLADPDSGFAFRAIYAFPNPAVGGQKPTVHVAVGRADKVTIRFYDVAGTPVHEATLDTPAVVNDESGPHWAYEYAWHGHIPSGVYIYSVTAEKAGHAPIKRVGKLAVVR